MADRTERAKQNASEKTEQARQVASEKAEQAKQVAVEKREQAKQVAEENGIVNASGAVVLAAAPMYLALIPLTSFLTKENSTIQKLGEVLINLIPGVASSSVTSGSAIPALSAIYLFWTFGASGAASAAGQAMARREGLDNDHPRKHVNNLTGLPLRLRSAHYALMENFPAFALAAALAQIMAPKDPQVVNLLAYHVIAKTLIHYPTYLANVSLPRTLAHISATSALINVLWRLAA